VKPWTRTQLLAEMLRSFRQGNIIIVPASFDPTVKSADAEYKWVGHRLHMKLRLDSAQDGGVSIVIHELLHAHADDPDCPHAHGILPQEWHPDLRENALQGVAEAMLKHLTEKYPRKFEMWRAAIIRKVGEE
jgi:hypothetical protein